MAKPDPLARALVDAALELHRRRLWLEVPIDAPFLIRVPDEASPLVATIIGHDGSDYGVVLARGDGALACMARALLDPHSDRVAFEQVSTLSATMDPLGEIPPHLRRIFDAAMFQARREAFSR